MSIRRNIIANYIGQGYTILIGIAVLPLYLKYLGAESYGLVGFFVVMQSWLQLFDVGISPTFAREVASVRGGSRDFFQLRRLLHSLEVIFLAIAASIGSGIVCGSTWIAHSWLKVVSLPLSEVRYCIALMGLMVALRCFAVLYSSGLKGMECQVWLNVAAVFIATLRFVGALALLCWVSSEPAHFFQYQLLVGVIELAVMRVRFYRVLPGSGVAFGFAWEPVRRVIPFAGGVAYLACVWILLTQLDKLLLSHLLPLKEYGYFAVATVVANGIMLISAPVSQALLPKMTYLLAQHEEQQMLALYRKATQLVAVIVFPLAGMAAVYSSELLLLWTGDRAAAQWAGPVLFWYVLGNGLLAVGAFQYYLQYAHGNLKMHVAFNTVFGAITVPVIAFAAYNYSALGTSKSWFFLNLVAFLVWPPVVHRVLAPGLHGKWCADLAPPLGATAVMLSLIGLVKIPFSSFSRLEAVGTLVAMALLLLTLNAVLSPATRGLLARTFSKNGPE